MIIKNIIIGEDIYGRELKCGDICIFKVNLQRPGHDEKLEQLSGMIIYDEYTLYPKPKTKVR